MANKIEFYIVQKEFGRCKTESELKDKLERYKDMLEDGELTSRQYWAIQGFYAQAVDRLRFNDRHLKAFERVGENGFRIKQ